MRFLDYPKELFLFYNAFSKLARNFSYGFPDKTGICGFLSRNSHIRQCCFTAICRHEQSPFPARIQAGKGLCLSVRNTAAANHLSVPLQGVLGDALSGGIVDKHQKMFHNRIHQSNHILRKISPFRKHRKGDNCFFCRICSPEWKTPELYSTVTLLARFRGLSTSSPFATLT